MVFVVNEEGRAPVRRQLPKVDARDLQAAVRRDGRVVGEELER